MRASALVTFDPQLEEGDVLLHCGHLGGQALDELRWTRFTPRLPFERPDGATAHARWRVVCSSCADAAGGELDAGVLVAHATWSGPAPALMVLPDDLN